MIARIDALLAQWGRRVIRQYSDGLGFPRETILHRLMVAANSVWNDVGSYVDYDAIDQAVETLPEDLQRVIVCHYVLMGPLEHRLHLCKCEKRTYYDRLNRAHVRIEDYFDRR